MPIGPSLSRSFVPCGSHAATQMGGPGYADTRFSRYVPHANRALRNFNMYLNLRQPPLRSRFPLTLFRSPSSHTSPPSPLRSPTTPRPPSPTRPLSKRSPSAVPITPIPPSSNPRGELIFSSRVDRSFRDSYDRYRSAFERRKEEKEREAFFTRTFAGRFLAAIPWNPLGPWPPPPPSPIEPTGKGEKGGDANRLGHGAKRSTSGSSTSTSNRGRLGNTPSGSRKSSPAPSRGKGPCRVGGTESRSSTPSSMITNPSTWTGSTYTTSSTSMRDSSSLTRSPPSP